MPRSPLSPFAHRTCGLALPSGIALAVALISAPAAAADLPFMAPAAAMSGAGFRGGNAYEGNGGFRVARVPVRPAPVRYDIYGYPLLAGGPSPLASGSGCPAALAPDFDPDGNFAGYAPIPMCR